jgi:hypothetical protein
MANPVGNSLMNALEFLALLKNIRFIMSEISACYRVDHRFRQAIFEHGGSVLSSLQLPQLPQKNEVYF